MLMTQVLSQWWRQLHTHPPNSREVTTADPQKAAHLTSEELVADSSFGEDFAELWALPSSLLADVSLH